MLHAERAAWLALAGIIGATWFNWDKNPSISHERQVTIQVIIINTTQGIFCMFVFSEDDDDVYLILRKTSRLISRKAWRENRDFSIRLARQSERSLHVHCTRV